MRKVASEVFKLTDPNFEGKYTGINKWNPLHYAIFNGEIDVVQSLIKSNYGLHLQSILPLPNGG